MGKLTDNLKKLSTAAETEIRKGLKGPDPSKIPLGTPRPPRPSVPGLKMKLHCNAYLGGTHPLDDVKPGTSSNVAHLIRLRVLPTGVFVEKQQPTLSFSKTGFQPVLELAWGEIFAVEVADASRTEIKSSVSQQKAGGLATPLFTTAPVSKTRSKFVGRSFVTIRSGRGEFVFDVQAEAATIEARLMPSRPLWKPAPPPEPAPSRDPMEQLRELAELRDAGVVTPEEFEEKKRELLKRI